MPDSSSSSIWPQALIQDLIEKAQRGETSIAELASPYEAKLFQYAVKNFKKNHRTGFDVFTRIEGNSLVLLRKPEVKVRESI